MNSSWTNPAVFAQCSATERVPGCMATLDLGGGGSGRRELNHVLQGFQGLLKVR